MRSTFRLVEDGAWRVWFRKQDKVILLPNVMGI